MTIDREALQPGTLHRPARAARGLAGLFLLLALSPHAASAQTLGGACTASPYSTDEISIVQNNIVVCNGSIWQNLLGAPSADPNYSIALGANALSTVTTGTYNVAIGYDAMLGTSAHPMTGAGYNTAVGDSALAVIQSNAIDNTAVGYGALTANTTGDYNTAVGYNALVANTTGNFNVAVGYRALQAVTSGSSNIGLGRQALEDTSTGSSNIGIGNYALFTNSSGISNVAIGPEALQYTTGSYSTAVGYYALDQATGSPNDALGGNAGFYISSGVSNVALGYEAMYGISATPMTGSYNTGVGNSALLVAQGAAANNTTFGYASGKAITTATDNTLVGYESGYGVTGSHNIILGEDPSSAITSGSSNILIGNSLSGLTNSSNYQLNIGNVITGTGLGTPSTSTVTFAGAVQITGAASGPSFMTTSDARIKTDITPVENALAGITALDGVTYTYRPPAEREVGKELSLPVDQRQMGVIAQNVEQVFPEAVGTMGTTGVKTVNYNVLMAPMIEAIKTLNRRIDALMAAVALLYVGLAVLFVMHMRNRFHERTQYRGNE